jgi:hypothetical protein
LSPRTRAASMAFGPAATYARIQDRDGLEAYKGRYVDVRA